MKIFIAGHKGMVGSAILKKIDKIIINKYLGFSFFEIDDYISQNINSLKFENTDLTKKIMFLGHMALKLVKCSQGIQECDDRDSYINKRIDTTGIMMANLFRQYYNKMIKEMKKNIMNYF